MMPADPNKIFEITITSFIKVNYEDGSENFEEIIKNQTKIYSNKKFIVGNQMSDERKIYRVDPMNLSVTKLKEEEQYTSIMADNMPPLNPSASSSPSTTITTYKSIINYFILILPLLLLAVNHR